jgi:hypothetical protein
MKLYAAFSEYQLIWPTTIRRTAQDALAAIRAEVEAGHIKPVGDPLVHGSCIGSFKNHPELMTGAGLQLPAPSQIKWIMGWRAPGWTAPGSDLSGPNTEHTSGASPSGVAIGSDQHGAGA